MNEGAPVAPPVLRDMDRSYRPGIGRVAHSARDHFEARDTGPGAPGDVKEKRGVLVHHGEEKERDISPVFRAHDRFWRTLGSNGGTGGEYLLIVPQVAGEPRAARAGRVSRGFVRVSRGFRKVDTWILDVELNFYKGMLAAFDLESQSVELAIRIRSSGNEVVFGIVASAEETDQQTFRGAVRLPVGGACWDGWERLSISRSPGLGSFETVGQLGI